MTTEINEEFETAVADGFKGTRSEFIASKKKKRDYFSEIINIVILSAVLTVLICVVGNTFVDYYINHTSTKLEYWFIVTLSVFIALLNSHIVFKTKGAE